MFARLLGTSPGPGGRGGQSVQRDQRSELKYFNVCLKQINSDLASIMIERAKGAGKKNVSLVRYPGTGHLLDLPHSPVSSAQPQFSRSKELRFLAVPSIKL